MKSNFFTRHLEYIFDIGVLIKGLTGFLEIIAGTFLLYMSPIFLDKTIILITQPELLEDPKDFIANFLVSLANNLSFKSQVFAAYYLLIHGVVKVFLITALLKKKVWAYPVSGVFFSLLILYEIYRFLISFSPTMLVLIILDILIVVLIFAEYKKIEKEIN